MQPKIPIQTIHLFAILDEKLIALLKSLSEEEWNKPTIAKLWTVKDIAAHLLDGNIRTLSFSRDNHVPAPSEALNSYKDLVAYLNKLNADWVAAMKRVSTPLLVQLLETTGMEYTKYLASLDPFEDAIFSVAWAGENTSKNWFHIAREYTEKWHHQQQIREAVSKEAILTKELFYPAMNTFMRGLPHTYENVHAENGTALKITITTGIGREWFLVYEEEKWELRLEYAGDCAAEVVLDPGVAWRLFTKGVSSEDALQTAIIKGNKVLGAHVLNLVAVMA